MLKTVNCDTCQSTGIYRNSEGERLICVTCEGEGSVTKPFAHMQELHEMLKLHIFKDDKDRFEFWDRAYSPVFGGAKPVEIMASRNKAGDVTVHTLVERAFSTSTDDDSDQMAITVLIDFDENEITYGDKMPIALGDDDVEFVETYLGNFLHQVKSGSLPCLHRLPV